MRHQESTRKQLPDQLRLSSKQGMLYFSGRRTYNDVPVFIKLSSFNGGGKSVAHLVICWSVLPHPALCALLRWILTQEKDLVA